MKPLSLASIGVGSTAGLAGTAVAVNHFYGGESIKSYIESKNKTSNKIFLTSETKDLATIKQKYTSSSGEKRVKPKKDGKEVEAKDLDTWCQGAIKEKFSSEESDTYKGIISWCYININSFAEELKKSKNKQISTEAETHETWTNAWTEYSKKREELNLKINGSSNDSELNGNAKEAGAKILHAWCKAKNDIKLYEDNAEDTFALFEKWCPTTKIT